MATHTQAFDKSIERARALFEVHRELHGHVGRPAQHVSDVLRGALVLAFAALDALVSDAIAELLPSLIRKQKTGPMVVRWIKDNPDLAAECLAETNPVEALARKLDETALMKNTFQRAEAVERVLKEYADCDVDWASIAAELTKRRVAGKSWAASDVKRRLNEFADRRNQIAHEGDLIPGRTKTNGIRLAYVEESVDMIDVVGHHVCTLAKKRKKAP